MSDSYHHAVLVRTQSVASFVTDLFVGADEFHSQEFDKLGVDEAREIVVAAYNRPIESKSQTFVLRAHFITLEAQNALLKVIEEPPLSSRFVIVVPADFVVLPTILSRCEVFLDSGESVVNEVFSAFLSADVKTRLEQIETAQKKKDVAWQRSMKQGLIEYVKTHAELASELEYCARLLLTRGASNKFLFEHAALTIPARSTR